MGLHAFQHGIEIVRVDLHDLSILHPGQRLRRLACEVAHDPHHKRQFLQFDGPAHLDVVGDLYARRADAIEFMLCALFRHMSSPKCPSALLRLSGAQGRIQITRLKERNPESFAHRDGTAPRTTPPAMPSAPWAALHSEQCPLSTMRFCTLPLLSCKPIPIGSPPPPFSTAPAGRKSVV